MTTKAFLGHFAFDMLRDLPDMEPLGEVGLLSTEKLLVGDFLPLASSAPVDDNDMA